ncbi:hypothetical protein [Glutamicibacter arilaitensis]
MNDFDAGREFMAQRHLDPDSQSVTSLLIGLESHFIRAVLGSQTSINLTIEIWTELKKRKFPVAVATSSGMSATLADTILALISLPTLRKHGYLVPAIETVESEIENCWIDLATTSFNKFRENDVPEADVRPQKVLIIPKALRPKELQSDEIVRIARNDEFLSYIFHPDFFVRVHQWFSKILLEGPEAALARIVPNASLFSSLEKKSQQDEYGRWLWDRLTVTQLDQWALTSLTHEWNWIKNADDHGIDRRFLRARETELERVTDTYFEKLLSVKTVQRSSNFSTASFTHAAVEKLRAGNPNEAAEIFAGLTEILPSSGEAWNNLGFRRMAFDLDSALKAFARSAQFSRSFAPIWIANHILALHLGGRTEEALLLSKLPVPPEHVDAVWAWEITSLPHRPTLIQVDDSNEYLEQVIAFVSRSS